MTEKIADNVLIVMSVALLLMGFGITVVGVVSLFAHDFSWLTLTWTIGAYAVSGFLFSIIGRGHVSGLTWSAG